MAHVWVDGEEIIRTPGHKFYAPEKGWTSAIDLKAGDILVLSNGEYVTVEKVQHELLEETVNVYNFEVEDFHTYYVGTDVSVLVHNQNCKNYPNDYSTKAKENKSAYYNSEGEARSVARTKVGHNPVDIGDNKLRSQDGVWQYRAKPVDTNDNHVHLERLNPDTGEVITNWRWRW